MHGEVVYPLTDVPTVAVRTLPSLTAVGQSTTTVEASLADPELTELVAVYRELIADELNVHAVHFVEPGSPEADVVRCSRALMPPWWLI